MIGLGQIPTIGNANRVHEMRLFQEVAKVDEKEAEQGAMHSDGVRLGNKDKEDLLLSRKGLAGKLSKLWLNLKTKAKEVTKDKPEDDCPIAKARAESEVGENAPIGWLTFDQMGNGSITGNGIPGNDGLVSPKPAETPSKESTSLSFLQPDPEDDDYLFQGEWFFSPAG